jgi:uncharacterized membrane protein
MAAELAGSPEKRGLDNEKVLGRILAFSDGVFAFAITLLIIDVRLPAGISSSDLSSALRELWPNYLSFLLSFFVIGLYWTAHVRLFRDIIRYDQNLIWLDLLFLLFIVVIPFSTSVLSLHVSQLSVTVYAIVMACAGYMHTILRLYAEGNHRLVDKTLHRSYIRRGILFSLFAPVGFTVSIGVAFLSSIAAIVLWVVIFFIHFIFQRRVKPKEITVSMKLKRE